MKSFQSKFQNYQLLTVNIKPTSPAEVAFMFCPRTRRAPFTSCFINGFRHLYSQLEYKVHYKIQPYIFRSTNYEYQNNIILSFLSTINSEYKGIKPQSDRDKT